MSIIITRFAYLKDCTLGWLYAGPLKLATIERPWIANPRGPGGLPQVSCVPDGIYNLRPHHSEKFPETYALVNESLGVYYQVLPAGQAWGRTAILIHKGNTVDDVIGCVAIGTAHVGKGVEQSAVALGKLRAALGRLPTIAQIRATAGTAEAA